MNRYVVFCTAVAEHLPPIDLVVHRVAMMTRCGVGIFFLLLLGCGASDSSSPATPVGHDGEMVDLPLSLGQLCAESRNLVGKLKDQPDHVPSQQRLSQLVSLTPEYAADTAITERQWIPIYELSETIRTSINRQPEQWDAPRIDEVIRLCQISEDAWESLGPEGQKERLLALEHQHREDEHHDHDDHDRDDDHDENHDGRAEDADRRPPGDGQARRGGRRTDGLGLASVLNLLAEGGLS
ncbi:hypothetical protein [Crateriforma conspicua]|uniref:Uncharacterized protein n=1 Tax=Crateriforma conspicua TaxID=2527996 RepID=A0A5C5Y736_9PLAN|nr:hypothetical protein [Crateriforma conspicua]QDV65176.1 hypothetical protein Mal65_43460 [Crateriforma conspicua]TWT70573.1 hypothetical protein Pan14r_28800 [Crateriforma conspicua]